MTPRSTRHTGGEPPTVAALQARYVAQVTGGSPDGSETWHNWIVRLRAGDVAVGYVQATVTDGGRVADVAWVIGTPWQGRGLRDRGGRRDDRLARGRRRRGRHGPRPCGQRRLRGGRARGSACGRPTRSRTGRRSGGSRPADRVRGSGRAPSAERPGPRAAGHGARRSGSAPRTPRGRPGRCSRPPPSRTRSPRLAAAAELQIIASATPWTRVRSWSSRLAESIAEPATNPRFQP